LYYQSGNELTDGRSSNLLLTFLQFPLVKLLPISLKGLFVKQETLTKLRKALLLFGEKEIAPSEFTGNIGSAVGRESKFTRPFSHR
jgi:hypothetical protein